MNNEIDEQTDNTPAPKVYPEQENPPRPTYAALVRGVSISGFLYYLGDGLLIRLEVANGGGVPESKELQFSIDDPKARIRAKNAWQNAVISVLLAV
jgi:hypothetical protein